MNEILDVIHNTIYQFFDICGDDEEVPISDKDKLLLEVNKAICNNLKALEQDSILDQIKEEIEQIEINGHIRDVECFSAGINAVLKIIDKYKVESEARNDT